ncbi:MAG: DnaJ domain-containing protein [Nitrososphaerales archaeon]|nr:DnaJ domain-containing protein [Nitrososphaerales archaeon]
MSDFYAVLGVTKAASGDAVKESYRKLALRYHPDRNRSPEAEERFKEVSEAHAVLSDDEKRALYDALGPKRYNDPREVYRYHLEREATMREMRSDYEAYKSARRDDIAKTTGTLLFFLFLLNLVPSWVLGPWYFIFNGFLLLSLGISVYEWFEV